MEPFNTTLWETLRKRIREVPEEDRVMALMYLAGARPTLVVRALDYARDVERDVDETLLQRPPES